MTMMKNDLFRILVVCTGNICRSPMAAGLLDNLISGQDDPEIEVDSAGIGAWMGLPASEEAIAVCKEKGIDISQHRSQPIRKYNIASSQLVLACARDHLRYLHKFAPEHKQKIVLLKNFGRKDVVADDSIADPIGKNHEFYSTVYADIEKEIKRIIPSIVQMAREKKNRPWNLSL